MPPNVACAASPSAGKTTSSSAPRQAARPQPSHTTLIETAKLNGVDPQAWLADTLARISDYKITKVDELLPWHWNG
ncbi:transposase domain-containing protein [Paracoccus sp. SY]|uniref:transposase domain-containing protein n=1 Tax=Paracoccus sp. SY TaxID=1330255 RepID=UPI001EFE98E9|nr:transposase domain-containing protein [Paracoccus sp. SY]